MKKWIIGIPALASIGTALAAYVPTYGASDMTGIVTDNLGEAGVQFKQFIPLFILGLALSGLAGIYLLVRRKVR
jgi:uncharacterized membrane protein YdcZ (DUF606 family)